MRFLPAERLAGLVILSTDVTPERDLIPALQRIGVHTAVSKIAYENPISAKSLSEIQAHLRAATALLPHDDILATVAFCCTSAAILIGEEVIEQTVRSVRASPPVISAAAAVQEVLKERALEEVALFAPYASEITTAIADHFEAAGLRVTETYSLGLDDDRTIATLDPAFIADWVCDAKVRAQAVLISCTALRSFQVEGAITNRIGRPVITSNGALFQAIRRRMAPPA